MWLLRRVITYDVWFAGGRGESGSGWEQHMDPTLVLLTHILFVFEDVCNNI